MTEFEAYLLSEWEAYIAHPERSRAALAVVEGLEISRVLDVGCGAGQELLPFIQKMRANGVGVDVSSEAVRVAERQFTAAGCSGHVDFICCGAESLPFANHTFDLVVCRLALPYTQNAAALSEMARVLRPAGRLILKIHHARFYFRRLWFALQHGSARMACSSAKVLLNGIFFHLTGRQPRPQFFSEVFQTRWMLRRILTPLSLQITEEMKNSDSNSRTPIFIIAKHPGA